MILDQKNTSADFLHKPRKCFIQSVMVEPERNKAHIKNFLRRHYPYQVKGFRVKYSVSASINAAPLRVMFFCPAIILHHALDIVNRETAKTIKT